MAAETKDINPYSSNAYRSPLGDIRVVTYEPSLLDTPINPFLETGESFLTAEQALRTLDSRVVVNTAGILLGAALKHSWKLVVASEILKLPESGKVNFKKLAIAGGAYLLGRGIIDLSRNTLYRAIAEHDGVQKLAREESARLAIFLIDTK